VPRASFDALRVKLLMAPKKQGMVTSYRSIRRKKPAEPQGPALAEFALARAYVMHEEPQYEVVKVSERRPVTWGVDLGRLADWLEEEQTGQRRLAL
jgi:hypothetical protein